MRYYLDTEFNGHRGQLLSLALVREDLLSYYGIVRITEKLDPWVKEHVIPFLRDVPARNVAIVNCASTAVLARDLEIFLCNDADPIIITDWPDDIKYFCQILITKPGEMVSIPRLKFEMVRVNAYPTMIADAVQHNAWWDAVALRQKLKDSHS